MFPLLARDDSYSLLSEIILTLKLMHMIPYSLNISRGNIFEVEPDFH